MPHPPRSPLHLTLVDLTLEPEMRQRGQHQTAIPHELSLWEKKRVEFTGSKSAHLLARNERSSKPAYSNHGDIINAIGDLFDGKRISPALPLPLLVDCLSEIWMDEEEKMF